MSISPKIFTIVAPSGTGKNTVLNALLKLDLPIARMMTMTSRPGRPDDKPGEYIFVSREQFLSAIDKGEMIEWVEYNNNLYGTRYQDLNKILGEGKSPLMQIDIRGAKFFKEKFPNAVSIFLSPGDLEVLRRRLVKRGMKESDIEDRLNIAKTELELSGELDHLIVNQDGKLQETVEELKKIITSELQKK